MVPVTKTRVYARMFPVLKSGVCSKRVPKIVPVEKSRVCSKRVTKMVPVVKSRVCSKKVPKMARFEIMGLY